MSAPLFLMPESARQIVDAHGSPTYVYDETLLRARAEEVLAFPSAFGFTARYAMKALPTAAVVQVLDDAGLHIDASSGYEAERALRAGVLPERIQLTAQELPANFEELVRQGVAFTACSLRQLAAFGAAFPGASVTVRFNPGLGSGHSNRTNVGGPSASFGIWHEHLPDVRAVADEYNLTIGGIHTHIGSGGDPETWVRVSGMVLDLAKQLPDVATVSLGGGFKIARMPGEPAADLQAIGKRVVPSFEAFAREHGRKLHLEVEPGTYLVANAGALLCQVADIVDTGANGYNFIKLDTGMNDILRPSLYGAQHPIHLLPATPDDRPVVDYVIVGHNCESGDILTPEPGNPEGLLPRTLPKAEVGDLVVIDGAGAYCSSMPAKNYNAFPESAEVMIRVDGTPQLIRRRQTLDQALQNELPL